MEAIAMSETEQSLIKSYPLGTLYFYLTKGCNLRCRHCWITPKFQGDGQVHPSLPPELFRSIIEQAKPLGLSGVKLTGGEPLIHPHITELLDYIRSEKLRLTVETNGVACTPELAQSIASCERTFVSVSLDGKDAETHEWVRGVKGCFDGALSGIRNLVDAGLHPQIIMTLMRRNVDHMASMVRLAESLNAESVKFNVLQPTARGEHMHESQETLPIEKLVELGRWVENDLSKSTKLRLTFDQPMAFRPLGKVYGSSGTGCGTCGVLGILGVLGDGSYALCGIGETVPEMLFGHAETHRLEDVWRTSPVLTEIREGMPKAFKGICGQCLMRSRCLGSCLAQNYYSNKDLWAPFWFCQQAHARGLFPVSRLAGEPEDRAAAVA
jgi:SynChlorMet cassette radical SAM/SPASM protein ScmF